MEPTKIFLDEDDMPKKWYNVQADMPTPVDPPYNPMTHEILKKEDMEPIFAKELINQEMSTKQYITIPEEVRDIYTIWRPSPLIRAARLERYLKTPAKIYYKWEGVSPAGSHKPNSAVPQAYYNMKEGTERLSTETGAGQWGSAISLAAKMFDLQCRVYMVRASYDQKPYRKSLMNAWGAECYPSPSNLTDTGRAMLEKDPTTGGSLGLAISEAVEDAAKHDNTNYVLGSVLNHVCIHQSLIGLETIKQFEQIDSYPDTVFGCVGGGSNFAGMAFPFARDVLDGSHPDTKIVGCEPMACPTLTKGLYEYDFGDCAGLTPILKMYTLGHDFMPPSIHAGGLRYHGDSPLLCRLVKDGTIQAQAHHQTESISAAVVFARTEGHVIAPESSHALKGAIEEALRCKETGEEKTIVFCNSGHGNFDLAAYDSYFNGSMVDYEYPAELVQQSLSKLPKV